MDELYPLFAVMIFTVAVMLGLIGLFRQWMIRRDKLLSALPQPAVPQSAASQPGHRVAA